MSDKTYSSEEDFLKYYDSNRFEKLSMTTDILIISIADKPTNNYRKTDNKSMSILLTKRKNYPFKDRWCLPGGFIDVNDDLESCPQKILARETNLKNIYLEQLYTFGNANRDPRTRVVSVAYMALIDKNELNYKLNDNTSWFDIMILEEENIVDVFLDNGSEQLKFTIKKTLKELTTDRYKYSIIQNDYLAFDHPIVILSGIERLKSKTAYTDIVFNMMPEYFTLGDLQKVYEVILGKKLIDPAFRRIIANKVEKTDKIKTGGGHRPSALFRYKKTI